MNPSNGRQQVRHKRELQVVRAGKDLQLLLDLGRMTMPLETISMEVIRHFGSDDRHVSLLAGAGNS